MSLSSQGSTPWKFRGDATASVGAITAVEFDPDVELLWVCDAFGTLMSFSLQSQGQGEAPAWVNYSSFSVSSRPVTNIFFLNMGGERMVTVADREVIRGYKRGGVLMMCLPQPTAVQNYIDLFQANNSTGAMFYTGNAGLTRLILNHQETDQLTVPMEATVVALKQCDRWVATGSASGAVYVRSASDLSVVGQVSPSRNRVMALEVFDNTVMAAYSERSATSFVKVFDVRKMSEAVSTIQDIPSGNVTQMRRYQDGFGLSSDRAFLLSPAGFHIIQLDQEKPVFSSSPLSEGSCTAVAVSPSNMCAAIGNDKGTFYALAHPATRDDYVMSTFVQPVRPKHPVYHHSWEEPNIADGFDDSVDLGTLASNWPEEDYMILTVPQKLRCVNYESHSIVPNEWGLMRADSCLPDPKDKLSSILPNPYPFNTQLGDDPACAQEALLELRKDMKRKHKSSRGGGGEYSPMEDSLQVCYSVQHKLDWRSYNEIAQRVIGIDNSFPECWITPLLQSLYLCQPPEFPIRKVILRHICKREFCMTCEIAFIFANMLTTSASVVGMKGEALPPIVPVAHFIRTLRQIRAFANTDVFQRPKNRDDAVAKMHLAQRLVLETLHKDLQDQKAYPFMNYEAPPEYEGAIAALFGTEFTSNGRVHIEPRFYWEVPGSALKVDEGLQHLLKQLEGYKDQVQIKQLPPIIVLLLNPEHSNLKPPTSLKISRAGKEDYNYVLNSNIVHLADDVEDTGNFVSQQRIKDDSFSLVNDYRVTAPMKMQELERLVPALRSYSAVVTFYALDNLTTPPYARLDDSRTPNLWHLLGPLLINDVLSRPLLRDPAKQAFRSPLSSYTEIRPGDLIAIDAEYVVLKWASRDEGNEMFYVSQRKPHMGLARVSCILSSKDGDERTIVDDYVHIPEEIEDYVTQYSGIHPGDLDPLESSKSLTSLKSTYLKLRALVDGGVVFVGHGLAQDFRVCNIVVPRKQIIDTLEIFHKPGSRYLSLRFLAYHVLGESVQEDEHDSIEDARTSLRLYRKYQQLKSEGTFEGVLDHLLAKGAETSWYVPDTKSLFRDTPQTPPVSVMGSPVLEKMAKAVQEDDEKDVNTFDMAAAAAVAAATDGDEDDEDGDDDAPTASEVLEAVRKSMER
ncbi:putative ubiquitin hydrolase [Leishmania major strain Friedlin]|uniref:Putative ubiquitin hydrolase n=1 Tax=Leishmania major TaxID=5664 RepID=Q4Q7T4_LEIMA|nr:putative ubiquitin hydrolase [Leishmania major strain Friedlin]CAG9578138.1 ubiquitin_hydrolase_-_putative [Leishmania major strain Friedlin]CAJ05817.1 putative ubiquitin hydrolase [Leishmania major strain Friedlin]|eukprot:XP_001684614.1 putative ubiquitin hydrolase [Leishmania major strain Friedlin]